jgi:hypothetical protein
MKNRKTGRSGQVIKSISHFGIQGRDKVRNFIIKHQDHSIDDIIPTREQMKKILRFMAMGMLAAGCGSPDTEPDWEISALPSSVRLDPVNNEIIDYRFDAVAQEYTGGRNLLEQNWIYNGELVKLHGARGEYVSFQLVLTSHTGSTLKDIHIEMAPFEGTDTRFNMDPELFLEWAVEVKSPSTGYPRASLGTGWYPDALIPLDLIQMDSSRVHRRWTYPLELPDFNNRIDDQRSLIVWVDQYIPFEREQAGPGTYSSIISVSIGNESAGIPVNIEVWDFAIPNENRFKASLQHEGFLSGMDPADELKIYHLFKRNRISLMDPTYKPELQISNSGEMQIGWDAFDRRLSKYFTGDAFTSQYGYAYGPGYGEPLETFILPFNVYGKHGDPGWPDIGNTEEERKPENQSLYRKVIREVRDHLMPMADPQKTELTVYLNGLDESYFPEAWDRMVLYGDIFKKDYPEVRFRIDGSYSEQAMEVVQHSISSWASHTINYDIDRIRKYQEMGIEDWIYGPMLYESRVNSWVGSSTFIDLPLVNDRAISWASWKYHTYSWISWGIGAGWERAWYDPESWKDTDKQLNGNGMLIYAPGIVPNIREACPSIRLKTMRDGVQEYEYMRLLSETDGHDERVNELVNSIIKRPFGETSIGNLDVWIYDAAQWDRQRLQLGKLIEESIKIK